MKENILTHIDYEPEEGKIVRFQLANGLTVVMMKTGVFPLAAVDLWYKVGSKDEVYGKSGFAHLFEHMMFQGSENVAKAEHMKLVNDVGGSVNGSTSKDRTNYFEVMPSNQLRLALWLEADRMRSLAITPENFENQLETVKEERRMRIDNAPYARVFYEMLDELAYENWAYKHSLIGSMDDLDNAPLEDVKKFHGLYYRPNNAVMAIVGDIQVQETLAMVKEYYDTIPAGSTPPIVDLTEPEQQSEKRIHWEDKFAPFPAYACTYHVPAYGKKQRYALDIIEKILAGGESSRLYKRFIEEEQSLLHLVANVDSKMGPGLFYFFGQIKPGNSMAKIEVTLQEEIDKLCNEKINEDELQKIKNQLKMEFVSKLEKVFYKADLLCFYTTCFDDPEIFYSELDRYMEINAEDLQTVAQKYLVSKNRSVIEVASPKKY